MAFAARSGSSGTPRRLCKRRQASNGGQDAIRRILFDVNGEAKTLLQLIQAKNVTQGKTPATRADLRFALGPDGQVFVLNKRDGTIRLLVPVAPKV